MKTLFNVLIFGAGFVGLLDGLLEGRIFRTLQTGVRAVSIAMFT